MLRNTKPEGWDETLATLVEGAKQRQAARQKATVWLGQQDVILDVVDLEEFPITDGGG